MDVETLTGKKACWVCSTRHTSSTIPALCSDACTSTWQHDHQILIDDKPIQLTEKEHAEERGHRTLQAQASGLVLSLYNADQLGYLAASDEWVNEHGWPLIEPLQEAATKLALDGQLPKFAEWFPAPSEDDRVGAEQAAAARLLPPGMPERAELLGESLPAARPRPKPRPPWWRRVLRRG